MFTLGVAGLLVACGGAAGSSSTTQPVPPTIEVTAADFGFAGLPATVPAGTTITLSNQSNVELHEFVALSYRMGILEPLRRSSAMKRRCGHSFRRWKPCSFRRRGARTSSRPSATAS